MGESPETTVGCMALRLENYFSPASPTDKNLNNYLCSWLRGHRIHLEEMFECVNCFEEPALDRFVTKNAVAKECSFCPAKENVPMAASIDEVSGHFVKCLFWEEDTTLKETASGSGNFAIGAFEM